MMPSNKLFGVTHDPDGTPRVIEPKSVKVGIGLAKGPALHAYIDLQRQWVIVSGYGPEQKRERFEEKERAQMRYRELKRDAIERKYPERLPYFTFTHMSSSGDMEPDWDIIEYHGPVPTEIDVIFVNEDPFSAAYQLWTATERKCWGDGKTALRLTSMAATADEKAQAAESIRKGEKSFPVTSCWLAGCQYSKPTSDRPSPCRAVGRLCFQLLRTPRLGATAVFNTAGYRSISQIFSSLEIFKRATNGHVAGIPLKMVLRPYRVNFSGRLSTQYAVSLEYRAESVVALKQQIIDQALQFQIAGREPLKQLKGMPAAEIPAGSAPPDENPAAIAAEFETPTTIDEPISPADQDDDQAYLGPGGDLEHAWEDAEAAVLNPTKPADPRAASDEIRKFYDLCRRKGMTDAFIVDHLGSLGFEKYEEVTTTALPDLVAWANTYKPTGQGSLL